MRSGINCKKKQYFVFRAIRLEPHTKTPKSHSQGVTRLYASVFFAGRRRTRRSAAELGGEKSHAFSGVQPLGLPVGERREDHRLRRHNRVHETTRAEVRLRGAATVGGGGRKRRTPG